MNTITAESEAADVKAHFYLSKESGDDFKAL